MLLAGGAEDLSHSFHFSFLSLGGPLIGCAENALSQEIGLNEPGSVGCCSDRMRQTFDRFRLLLISIAG